MYPGNMGNKVFKSLQDQTLYDLQDIVKLKNGMRDYITKKSLGNNNSAFPLHIPNYDYQQNIDLPTIKLAPLGPTGPSPEIMTLLSDSESEDNNTEHKLGGAGGEDPKRLKSNIQGQNLNVSSTITQDDMS